MISKEEVKHIAKLARLGLTEKELEKYQKEFLKILNYIEKLKEVNVCRSQTTPNLAQSDSDRIMRKDEVLKFEKKLIDGHLKVRSIL